MFEFTDSEIQPGLGDGFPEEVISPFRDQAQLDFEIGFYQNILQQHDCYVDVLHCLGELLTLKGLHQQGLEIDQRLTALLPHDSFAHYNLACSLALLGRKQEAFAALHQAIADGYDDLAHLEIDSDLDSLRQEPEYKRVVQECRRKLKKRKR